MTSISSWRLESNFGLENLIGRTSSLDPPGDSEVLVEVEAISLNYRDLLMVAGRYNPRQPLPLVPGSDACGRVLSVGNRVTRLQVGDRVCTTFSQRWETGAPNRQTYSSTLGGPLDGAFRTHLTLSEAGLVRAPNGWTAVQAATLPCAGVTAWNALFGLGDVVAGETVLVIGTGGVGLFCLQLAGNRGANVLVVSSSDAKLDRARALGASGGINYLQEPEWGREIKARNGGEGVDHVIELGGAATLSQSLAAVRPGGTISLIGNLGGNECTLSVVPILMRQVRLQGVFVGPRDAFEGLVRDLEQTSVLPQIDRVFPYQELPEALRYLESGKHFGKVCLEL